MATTHQAFNHLEKNYSTIKDRVGSQQSMSTDQSEQPPTVPSESHDTPFEEPSSAINELQTAFASILLARKDVDPVTDYSKSSNWNGNTPKLPKRPPLPKWTGAFELFSFPRELRDSIYYHYLYRPNGIRYHRRTNHTFPFDHPEEITSLFLTCRQVYQEALQVFCRYNQIEINASGYWQYRSNDSRALNGTLRLFPDKPGRLVQRVRKRYQEYMHVHVSYSNVLLAQKPGDAFLQMLRDAYTFKNAFTMLREFTVCWEANPHFFATQENLIFEEKSEEEKVQMWLDWMQRWLRGSNVIPPGWVRFKFDSNWRNNRMQNYASALNGAYSRLLRDTTTVEGQQIHLEESGKRWLEETSQERKKRRKKAS